MPLLTVFLRAIVASRKHLDISPLASLLLDWMLPARLAFALSFCGLDTLLPFLTQSFAHML